MFLTKRFIQNRVQSNSIYLNYANFFIKKWLLCAHTGVNCASFCIFFWYFLHFTFILCTFVLALKAVSKVYYRLP